MNKGRIHQVIGPVIDIKFKEDEMPELLNAVDIELDGMKLSLRAEDLFPSFYLGITGCEGPCRFYGLTVE